MRRDPRDRYRGRRQHSGIVCAASMLLAAAALSACSDPPLHARVAAPAAGNTASGASAAPSAAALLNSPQCLDLASPVVVKMMSALQALPAAASPAQTIAARSDIAAGVSALRAAAQQAPDQAKTAALTAADAITTYAANTGSQDALSRTVTALGALDKATGKKCAA